MKKRGSPQEGELWFQMACIETPDWEDLPDEAILEIVTSDNLGLWRTELEKNKKGLFLKFFTQTGAGLFQKTILIKEVNKGGRAYLVIYTDPSGKAIDPEAKGLSMKIVESDFQFLSTAPEPER